MTSQNSSTHTRSIPLIVNVFGALFVLAVVQRVQERGNMYCYNVLAVDTFGAEYFEHDESVDLVVGNKDIVGRVLVALVGDK